MRYLSSTGSIRVDFRARTSSRRYRGEGRTSTQVEIRRRNLIDKGVMPYALGLDTLGTDIVYDFGDYAILMDRHLSRRLE